MIQALPLHRTLRRVTNKIAQQVTKNKIDNNYSFNIVVDINIF